MINIKNKQVGLPPSNATKLQIRVEFNLGASESRVFWIVLNADNEHLLTGTLAIPTETHNAWGVDDSVIEDYVLGQLNLERL